MGILNKQMLSSAKKPCIIQLLGYSVEEAYCSLGFDFARVCSSRSDREELPTARSDREELPTDEGFHIRRGSFSYGKEETANVNSVGKVQLITMFSYPIALPQNGFCSDCFAKVVENQTSPYFLPDIIWLFRMKMS